MNFFKKNPKTRVIIIISSVRWCYNMEVSGRVGTNAPFSYVSVLRTLLIGLGGAFCAEDSQSLCYRMVYSNEMYNS